MMNRQHWLRLALSVSISVTVLPSLASSNAMATEFQSLQPSEEVTHQQIKALYNESGSPAVIYTGLELALRQKENGRLSSGNNRSASTLALKEGIVNYNKGYLDKAIPLFEKATRLSADSQMAYLWLGRTYKRQGTPEGFARARQAFEQLLTLNPTVFEALSGLGELLTWNPAERERGITLLQKAVQQKPGDLETIKKLALAYSWNSRYEDAAHYAKLASALVTSDAEWAGEYAQILARAGYTQDAVSVFDKPVLKQQLQKNMLLQIGYAKALAQNGEEERARAIFSQLADQAIADHSSERHHVLEKVATLAYDLGFFEDALRLDNAFSPALHQTKPVQLRDARSLARLFRNPEAIERYQSLYTAGLLSVNDKLEYAEFLTGLHLPTEALPQSNLMAQLAQEVLSAQGGENQAPALRLARLYASQPDQFESALSLYKRVLSSVGDAYYEAVEKEFLDTVKNNKANPARSNAEFQALLQQSPESIPVQAAYAEFLSWNPATQADALSRYVKIAKRDKKNAAQWEAKIEEVLQWLKPSTQHMAIYQDILDVYPGNKTAWHTVARSYRDDTTASREAVKTYSKLVKEYPGDRTIKKEWLGLLISDEKHRSENLKLLGKMSHETSADVDVLATYGKLLSYSHQYDDAIRQFDTVLQKDATHREALLGKGYTLLWSGEKFKAKKFLTSLHEQYPDDLDVAIGLAQACKQIGRYDEAFKILQKAKPFMDSPGGAQPEQNQSDNQEPQNYKPLGHSGLMLPNETPLLNTGFSLPFVLVANPQSGDPSMRPVLDYSIAVEPVNDSRTEVSGLSKLPENPVRVTVTQDAEQLHQEVDSLTAAVEALKLIQESSRGQLDRLGRDIQQMQQAVPQTASLNEPSSSFAVLPESGAGSGSDSAGHGNSRLAESEPIYGSSSGFAGQDALVGQDGMKQVQGVYSSLDYDTNPLLSGVGRLKNDQLADLETSMMNDLRPMFRLGYLYSTQDGEDTTTKLSYWGFPNQLSLSLTPQMRIRGGIQPTRYALPNGVSPDSSWGTRYGLGATLKYWDRLTLDGDIALTHFSQSNSNNITFNTEAKYDFTDSIRAKIGFNRLPQYTSLLTTAGLKPNRGAFSGDLLGQARENSLFAELNTNPFNQNWDWNLGYSWAFLDGSHVPTNYKNQAFTSLGHTWHYGQSQQVRLGYEFLYFGYSKNTTNGFFDTTATGLTRPVSSLRPPTLANSRYDFGGYYSPGLFIMNAFRLDFRGSLFDKFLEYKLGGSLGTQSVRLGNGIKGEGNSTTLSTAFDGNAIMNFTDWLALYGDVDFLDAGGQFNRWRFGGGLIVRPHIKTLSPVFGK